VAIEAQHRLDQQVAAAIPNFREIDNDPNWHRFLLTTDALSGRVRQQLLNDAIANSDANRVVAFFRQFLGEEAASGQAGHAASAAPGRARPAAPAPAPSGRIYSREEIAKLYAQKMRGAYRDREAEWARQEVDIIRAGREGRIRNPIVDLGK
jgi:hypothetical protein